MGHIHSIYDTDKHFVIDPITRSITTESKKILLMQGDHNSERITFELPRYIEGHDMTLCNVTRIHYDNTSSNKVDVSSDFYEPSDVQLYPEDENVIIFSWEVSGNATVYDGNLTFSVRLYCMNEDGTVDYSWGTDIFSSIKIGKSKDNSQLVIDRNPDAFQQLKKDLEGAGKLIVNINDEYVNDEWITVVDKNYDEIREAINSGKTVDVRNRELFYSIIDMRHDRFEQVITFGRVRDNSQQLVRVYGDNHVEISDVALGGDLYTDWYSGLETENETVIGAINEVNEKASPLIVTVTNASEEPPTDNASTYGLVTNERLYVTLDKTFDEIAAAVNGGKEVVIRCPNNVMWSLAPMPMAGVIGDSTLDFRLSDTMSIEGAVSQLMFTTTYHPDLYGVGAMLVSKEYGNIIIRVALQPALSTELNTESNYIPYAINEVNSKAPFHVTITNEDGPYVSDKTFADILAAHNAGACIRGRYLNNTYDLVKITNTYAELISMSLTGCERFIVRSDGVINVMYTAFNKGCITETGEYETLETTNKTIVGAINELNEKMSYSEQLTVLIEEDMLPAVHDTNGAILTDENGNVVLRY